MDIKAKVEQYSEEMKQRLATLVSYDSVSNYDATNSEHPFGEVCTQVLNKALEYGKEDGFAVLNVDNMAGHIEYGQGEPIIGVLGHLDIVPCGEGWSTNPLEMIEKDGVLYGRGVMDDKGPVVAALTALKIIKDSGIEVNKRIRLIIGINEEKGSKCIHHYVEKIGVVDYGFTPDGNFPLIFGEKGSIRGSFTGKSEAIIKINGGTVMNAVCFKVNALVKKSSVDKDLASAYLKESPVVDFSIIETEDAYDITVIGKAAHASTPNEGINAISYLMGALAAGKCEDSFVTNYNRVFGLSTDGSNAGISCSDEYGALTCVTGVIHSNDNGIEGTIDIRVPVQVDPNTLVETLTGAGNNLFTVTVNHVGKPLFYDPSSPFIQQLLKAYQQVSGDTTSQPMVIGGGTYAQAMPNVIAFGGEFVGGHDYKIHDVDESIPFEELKLQTQIYVQAILNLLEM